MNTLKELLKDGVNHFVIRSKSVLVTNNTEFNSWYYTVFIKSEDNNYPGFNVCTEKDYKNTLLEKDLNNEEERFLKDLVNNVYKSVIKSSDGEVFELISKPFKKDFE